MSPAITVIGLWWVLKWSIHNNPNLHISFGSSVFMWLWPMSTVNIDIIWDIKVDICRDLVVGCTCILIFVLGIASNLSSFTCVDWHRGWTSESWWKSYSSWWRESRALCQIWFYVLEISGKWKHVWEHRVPDEWCPWLLKCLHVQLGKNQARLSITWMIQLRSSRCCKAWHQPLTRWLPLLCPALQTLHPSVFRYQTPSLATFRTFPNTINDVPFWFWVYKVWYFEM